MIWNMESPIYLRPGDIRKLTMTFDPAPGSDTPSVTSPSAKIWVNNVDMSSTYLSGSASASGNTVTLPTITGLVKDTRYVLAVTASVDSVVKIKKALIIVPANGYESDCAFEDWMVDGDYWNVSIAMHGITNITAVSTAAYQNLSSAAILSGSDTYSGNSVFPKVASGFTAGLKYVIEVTVTADGQTIIIPFLLHIQKESDEQ